MCIYRINLELQPSPNYSTGQLTQDSCSLTAQSRAITNRLVGFAKVRWFFSPQTSLKEGNRGISTRKKCCAAGMSSSSKILLLLWVACHSITSSLQGKHGMERTDRRLSKKGEAVVCTEATPRPTVKLSPDLLFGDLLTSGIQ